LSIRIDLVSKGRIGPRKIPLLDNINSCGSISAACRAFNMSNAKNPAAIADEDDFLSH